MYTKTHGSRTHNSSCCTKINLPPSMPAGAVIGFGGHNIKMLQQRSGDMQCSQACAAPQFLSLVEACKWRCTRVSGSSWLCALQPVQLQSGCAVPQRGPDHSHKQPCMPPGARVFIGPGGEVVISGSPSAVQAAAALVKQQIESFLASGEQQEGAGGYSPATILAPKQNACK